MTALYYAFAAGLGTGFVIALGAVAVMAARTLGEDQLPEIEQPRRWQD